MAYGQSFVCRDFNLGYSVLALKWIPMSGPVPPVDSGLSRARQGPYRGQELLRPPLYTHSLDHSASYLVNTSVCWGEL